ncbi:HNH endonuclease signature motif containing protein [Limimaricola variabilis]
MALMARGVPNHLAENLIESGYTVGSLSKLPKSKLENLGLVGSMAERLKGETRPPVPPKNLISVLFKNRWCCCVCRDSNKSITVHHINEWHESRDHSEANLAVLCLDHHDEAHTTRLLSRSLTSERIASFKKEWEAKVTQLDTEEIRRAASFNDAMWLYFNRRRIFDIIGEDLDLVKQQKAFVHCQRLGLISDDGVPDLAKCERENYAYSFGRGSDLSGYMGMLIDYILCTYGAINISDHFDSDLPGMGLIEGQLVFVQGRHQFKSHKGSPDRGVGQLKYGTRKANNITLRYSFDAWEASSSSAWACWLRGTQNVGSLVQIKNIVKDGRAVKIDATCLAICWGANGLKTRDYSNFYQ